MKQKGFVNILVIIGFIIIAGIAGYFAGYYQIFSPITLPNSLPDPPLISGIECKKDSECPSAKYSCEATQGEGIACPSDDPSCVPASTIIKGICKLKEGNRCWVDSDCVGGLLCHANVCASQIGRQCNGSNDTSCPADYECVQGCGWPVPRPDEPSPSYFCQLKGLIRNCPICLAENTFIDTPSGPIPIKDLQVGMPIWTTNKAGHRISGIIMKTSKVPVPPAHQMVRLVLNDGRELYASLGHPITDGRTVGHLKTGDVYDGASVVSAARVAYGQNATYDVLASGETGFYWANGILLDSTIH